MATKAEIIANYKKEYSTLKSGSDETGYTDLSAEEYDTTIARWADNKLAEDAKVLELEKIAEDKATLLAKLGITADEAKLLLS